MNANVCRTGALEVAFLRKLRVFIDWVELADADVYWRCGHVTLVILCGAERGSKTDDFSLFME